MQRADLVVHDSTEAHDADVDVVFLTHQSGVFQRSPAGQCVAAERSYRTQQQVSEKRKRKTQVYDHLSTNKKTDAISE